MDPFTLIAESWWAGIPVAFVMGVLLTANPAALPVLGAALGVGASGELATRRGSVKLVGAFGAGMALVYGVVGVFAGSVDEVTERFLRPYSGIGYVVLAAVLTALGLYLLLRPASFCEACVRPAKRSVTVAGAVLAGIPAGFVNCPACAGVILGVAASAADLGNVLHSTGVMLALGAGHAGSLVLLAHLAVSGWRLPPRVARVSRAVLALMLLALAGYFGYLASVQGLNGGFRLV